MKKVIIIGCPGSGKSTFARKLKGLTSLPLYHLDMLYWNSDGTNVGRDVFIERLNTVLDSDEWIIDGNYGSTLETRFKECDTVFFLDYATEVCLEGIKARAGKPRSDMPWTESEKLDEEFVLFVKNYNTDSRNRVMELIEKYADKDIIVFCNRAECERYLERMTEVLKNEHTGNNI